MARDNKQRSDRSIGWFNSLRSPKWSINALQVAAIRYPLCGSFTVISLCDYIQTWIPNISCQHGVRVTCHSSLFIEPCCTNTMISFWRVNTHLEHGLFGSLRGNILCRPKCGDVAFISGTSRISVSLDYMLAFIYLAYFIMAFVARQPQNRDCGRKLTSTFASKGRSPFPEDFAIRALFWAGGYYSEAYFTNGEIDEEEKFHEQASMKLWRKERSL